MRLNTVCLASLLACGLSGCRPAGNTTATTRDGRVQVTLPPGWAEATLPNATGLLQAKSVIKDAYVDVFVTAKADVTEGLQAFADRNRAAMARASKVQGRQATPMEQVAVAGGTGYRYTVTGTFNGIRLVYVNTYVETARQIVHVECWTLPSHEDEARPDFEFIAAHLVDAPPH